MSEKISIQSAIIDPRLPVVQPEAITSELATHDTFKNWLEQSSSQIPELATNRPEIEAAGVEIIDAYDIAPSLFDVPARSLIFSAIANHWSKWREEPKERIYTESVLALLAYDHSLKLKDIFDRAQGEGISPSEEHRLAIYNKYTDQQMTAELKQAIDNGLLNDVKTKLGITPQNEDAYEVHVLSIGDFLGTYGMSAPQLPHSSNPFIENSTVKNSVEHDDIVVLQAMIKEWALGLEIRQEAFAQELDQSSAKSLGHAWITQVRGKTFLCLQAPTVEKILHPEVTSNNQYYTEQDAADELASLQHEYVHTQEGLNIDHGTNFGISIEELRAEHFSGNRLGYQDIKSFARDFGIATGKDLANYLAGKEKGDVVTVYTELAKDIGLDRMLETILVKPSVYGRSNVLDVVIADHLGGFDGVIWRLIADKALAGKYQEIEGRIDVAAKRYIQTANPEFLSTFFSRRKARGSVLLTEKLEKRVEELQAVV